ncbi:hypothetical protein G7046_g9764 [Stylonectria norvegica]|nr:hypothetical protein G7046_g9764 [Stylonectria norvegica]
MRLLSFATLLPYSLLLNIAPALSQDVIARETDSDPTGPLSYTDVAPGHAVKDGTKLRVLGVGDSIVAGYLSDMDGGNGDGFRLKLRQDLSKDEVVYAGTQSANGTISDNYFAAWPGKTIKYIADRVGPSLKQQPNIVLLHAGTNDMNPDHSKSTEGDDPAGAAERLGDLIDQIIKECPDAVLLVAMILNTCKPSQSARTKEYQALIPETVRKRRAQGHHALAVDFTTFSTDDLRDCIHPTNDGYAKFGDYWYSFMTQIPSDWITAPVGDDPDRPDTDVLSKGDALGVNCRLAAFIAALAGLLM